MGISKVGMSAVISECGLYRYRLERAVATGGKTAAIIMVNPSTADATTDDQSIRKLKGFAAQFGFGRIIVGNKFAYRVTNVKELRGVPDPIGPENDKHIENILQDSDIHLVAWGRLGKLSAPLRGRWRRVVEIANSLGCELHCLGTTRDGHPLHPLTLKYDRELVKWDSNISVQR